MKKAIKLLAWGVAAITLGACTFGVQNVERNQQVSQQFLTERNNGTPVALGGKNDPALSVIGTVERVDGATLTVKQPLDDASRTLQLSADTHIRKQVELPIGAIKVGDRLTAFGAQQEQVFQATAVQVGASDLLLGGPIQLQRSAGETTANEPGRDPVIVQRSSPPSPGAGNDVSVGKHILATPPVSGVVQQIDGMKIELKQDDGSAITIELQPEAHARTLADAQASDIQVGSFVLAQGSQHGPAWQATQVDILPAPPSQ
jgi:hypothetical protein